MEAFLFGLGVLISCSSCPGDGHTAGLCPVLPLGPPPSLPASGPSIVSLPGSPSPLSSCLSSHLFQVAPAQVVYPSEGPSGCFSPNYGLTTNAKTNVLGFGGGGGSDRLVPGSLIKGDLLGLGGDESGS